MAVLFAVGVLTVCSVPGASAHRGRVFGPSFGSPGSGAGQLSLVELTRTENGNVEGEGGSGLAVDAGTHDVYVADTGNHRVDEFASSGAFVRAWGWGVVNGATEFQVCTEATGCRAGIPGVNPGQFEKPMFVAVDDSPGGEGDVYVADFTYEFGSSPDIVVQKFTASGKLIESWADKGRLDESVLAPILLGRIRGIAVLPSGELLVSSEDVFEFAQSSGSYIANVGRGEAWSVGLPVDGANNFYYLGIDFNDFALYIIYRSGLDSGERDAIFRLGALATGLAVSRSGELYVDEGGGAIQVVSASCVSLCAASTTFTSPRLTGGAGLAVDSERETVYIAETAANEIESIVPEPPAAPLVEAGSQSVSGVSADSASVSAVVDPRSDAGEEPTSYRFEYASEESFQRVGFVGASSVPVPDGQLLPSFESEVVTAHFQGLQSGTVYHYRVVAENRVSRSEGRPVEGERDEAGNEVERTFTTQPVGGFGLLDGRSWELVSPPDKHGSLLELNPEAFLAQAAGDGSAVTYTGSTPTELGASGNSLDTQVFSVRDAAAGSWVSRDISTPRELASGYGAVEFRYFSTDLARSVVDPYGSFSPLLSPEASEQTAYLRSDFAVGDASSPCVSSCYRPLATAAPGFANVPEGTVLDLEGIHGNSGQVACREVSCGPFFVGATPDGKHVFVKAKAALTEGAPANSLYEWTDGQLELASILPNEEPSPVGGDVGQWFGDFRLGAARNAISTDGSRLVWSVGAGKRGSALYLRDMKHEETVLLSPRAETPVFQGASSDDSRVFFTAGGDLYVFEAPVGGPLSAGHTVNLTPGGGVQEYVPGVSQDGSYVYFVAGTVLSGGESNEHGEMAVAGEPNLYVEHEGAIKFIAVLSPGDGPDWEFKTYEGLKYLTARVSANGLWLAFMSARPLTGYDNRDVSSGASDEEVFVYDAAGNAGRGSLACASCDPTGARPHGALLTSTEGKNALVDKIHVWGGRWVAANVPVWSTPLYQSRYLSDSGRLFFNSSDALVPSDINGTEDVYEFEPLGVGTCTSASVAFAARSGGCVNLVSTGTSGEESAFVDASESGDDVFFMTSAQLVASDNDSVPDVYDARVDGGFPAGQPVPACEGDACQSPVAPPSDPTPGSLTYRGSGNPMPLLTPSKVTTHKALKCAKSKKLRRGKCVTSKKKSRKAKKASRTGRAGDKRRAKS